MEQLFVALRVGFIYSSPALPSPCTRSGGRKERRGNTFLSRKAQLRELDTSLLTWFFLAEHEAWRITHSFLGNVDSEHWCVCRQGFAPIWAPPRRGRCIHPAASVSNWEVTREHSFLFMRPVSTSLWYYYDSQTRKGISETNRKRICIYVAVSDSQFKTWILYVLGWKFIKFRGIQQEPRIKGLGSNCWLTDFIKLINRESQWPCILEYPLSALAQFASRIVTTEEKGYGESDAVVRKSIHNSNSYSAIAPSSSSVKPVLTRSCLGIGHYWWPRKNREATTLTWWQWSSQRRMMWTLSWQSVFQISLSLSKKPAFPFDIGRMKRKLCIN